MLIIIGSVQVAVQIEEEKQENEVSPDLMSDKGVSTAMESEAGKECIEMEEIGKSENSGMYCFTKVNIYKSCGKLSTLKVRYSQKKNVGSLIFQRCSEIIARISALACKMGQIKKIMEFYYIIWYIITNLHDNVP
jgi:hypothetical protein